MSFIAKLLQREQLAARKTRSVTPANAGVPLPFAEVGFPLSRE
jgi:hypothetical protein